MAFIPGCNIWMAYMTIGDIYKKIRLLEELSVEEGMWLYHNVPTPELMWMAHEVRQMLHPENEVTWLVDRNINSTNICISRCKFCNFCRKAESSEAYVTTDDQYREKINELYRYGGNQILLQGGLHPQLGLSFYGDLFRWLKEVYPDLQLHALSPPEIIHIARLEHMTPEDVLEKLVDAGLDSLPGGGAEILSDRVRRLISPGKATTNEWLQVMHKAHDMDLVTSATMMFGHVETLEERLEHMLRIRATQNRKPVHHTGFIAFIPWPFQGSDTRMNQYGPFDPVTSDDYAKMVALSRIMLPNISHIQPSWLTVGKDTAQICLHGGGDDFGSIMIEEQVVSSAGSHNRMNKEEIRDAIREAGFQPVQRNQKYEKINEQEGS